MYEQIYSTPPSGRKSAADRVIGTVEMALKEQIFEESFDIDNGDSDINVDASHYNNDYDLGLPNPNLTKKMIFCSKKIQMA